MHYRILQLPLFVLLMLFAGSCTFVPSGRNESSSLPKTGETGIKTVRPEREWFLHHGDLAEEPIALLHDGRISLPLHNYRLTTGFSHRESWGIWTDGELAEMQISVPHAMRGNHLSLDFPRVNYIFAPRQAAYSMRIKVNGQELLQREIRPNTRRDLKIDIPSELTRSGLLTVTFQFSGIHPLTELGKKDSRTLALGLVRLPGRHTTRHLARAFCRVAKCSAPNRHVQSAELLLLEQFYGPKLPDSFSTFLYPAAIDPDDPVKQYRPGDILELILMQDRDRWIPLYGGATTPREHMLRTGNPMKIDGYYRKFMIPPGNPHLPREVVQRQQQQIMTDLPVIRLRLKNIRRDHALTERLERIWLREQKKYERIPKIISPETGQEIERFQNQFRWINRHGAFFALPGKAVFGEAAGIAHNIAALNTLHNLFRKHQIQLLVMLIPDADQIARGAFMSDTAGIGDPVSLQCAATLLEYGIEAIYPDDAVLAAVPVTERLFCYPDGQPEADLWKILADLAAKRLKRFGEKAFVENQPSHFAQRRGKTAFGRNYRWPEKVDCGDHKCGSPVESVEVFRNGVPFQPDPHSRILVIGGETLRLPGPGHTFSGLLSMRLQYPVDELVINGETWFHNLAEELSQNLHRYLSMKQVCLLMITPRMLAKNRFPDIEERIGTYARLRQKQPVLRIPLPEGKKDLRPPEPIPGERLFRQKQEWNRQWNLFCRDLPSIAAVRLEDHDREQFFLKFDLPENRERKPFTLVMELACYPGQAVTLSVNEQKIPLLINTDNPHFRPAAVELAPGTKTVKLHFSGKRDHLILVREAMLYQ